MSILQIIQMVRGQLKSMDTVGQILDVMKFSVKMLLVEKSVGDIGIILLNEIFQLLPKNWEEDPVKVCTTATLFFIFSSFIPFQTQCKYAKNIHLNSFYLYSLMCS